MDNSFSFSRLWLLIKKQWFDNSKLYTLSFLALIGLIAIIFIFWITFNDSHRFEESSIDITFYVLLFATGLIFASTTFGALGDKAKGTYWLTVPATHFEKLLCGLFYSVVVFLAIYVTSFFLIQKISFFFIRLNPKNTLERWNDFRETLVIVMTIYTALQSLFVLGSVYFEKFAFIKTIITALVLFFIYALLVNFLMHNLFTDGMNMQGLTSFKIYDGGQDAKVYRLTPWIEEVITPLLKYMWAPILFTAAYFRLKEKEI